MKFAAFLFVGLLATLASTASAAPATADLSWTAPDTRVDGTILEASEIAEYRVYYSIDGTPTGAGEFIPVSGAVAETVTLDLTPRVELYVVQFAVTTVDTTGQVSALSNVVSKTFTVKSTAAPNPPTNLQFTIACGDGCTITEKTGQ